jgi:phosphatidylglycerophosphate synthase
MQVPKFLSQSKISLDELVNKFVPKNVSPNIITLVGLGINVLLVVLYFFSTIRLEPFLILYFLTQLFDILDGSLARVRNLTSNTGRLLDTGCDIVGGILLIVVIAVKTNQLSWVWIGILALVYVIRWYFVYRNEDRDIGGYKNALVVGLLLAYYREFDGTVIVQLVALFNVVVVGLNVQDLFGKKSSKALTKR